MTEKQAPEMETTQKCADCCKGGHCHGGRHFWIWAAIRIAIVVGLIVGAFCLGTEVGSHRGFGEFEDRGGYMRDGGNFRGGQGQMPRDMHMMPGGQMMQNVGTPESAQSGSGTPAPVTTGTGK